MPVLRRSLVVATVAVSLGLGAVVTACGSDASGPEVELSAAGKQGQTIAKEQGCISCHTSDGSKSSGPTWKGLAGSTVTLEDGTKVTADDEYLRTAILAGRDEVVDGYANIMPVYKGIVSDEEVADIIAYLHDLSPESTESTN